MSNSLRTDAALVPTLCQAELFKCTMSLILTQISAWLALLSLLERRVDYGQRSVLCPRSHSS